MKVESEASTESEVGAKPEDGATPSSKDDTASELGATPDSEAEQKAVECFAALKTADEGLFDAGMTFGHAVRNLHDEIKRKGSRDFMARIKQLGISYERARYWMAKAGGEDPNRHKKDQDAAEEKQGPSWGTATADLHKVADDVERLKDDDPGGDRKDLIDLLFRLAEILDYELIKKGEQNEPSILQRVQPTRSGVAEGANEGKADSAGGGR